MKWISLVGPIAAALPLFLWQCGGDSSVVAPDAGADATSSSSGSGGTTSSSGSGGTASSSGSGGTASSSGSGGTASSSGSGSGSGSSSGGGPVLCTAPNMPPGCVECITDAQCSTAAPHCLNNACVVCRDSTDCGTGTTPVCQPSDHTCHASCAVDGGMRCNPASATPICDTTSGACVGCRVGGNDCRIQAPVCNPGTQQCVQCVTNMDCNGLMTPLCNTQTNTCVVCVTNADCATSMAGPVCRLVTHTCAAGCVNDTQCADAGIAGTDASAPRCNTTNNTCVECLGSTDCSAATPFCDTQAPPAGPAGRADRCQACLPAALAGDAGMVGCDGGPGSNCQVQVGTAGAGQFVCR